MTQDEFILALIATVIGSPLIYESIKALVNWARGRLTKVAALEAALEEAQAAIDELRARKQTLRAAHRDEISDLHREIRAFEEKVHQLRLKLLSLGVNPDEPCE